MIAFDKLFLHLYLHVTLIFYIYILFCMQPHDSNENFSNYSSQTLVRSEIDPMGLGFYLTSVYGISKQHNGFCTLDIRGRH